MLLPPPPKRDTAQPSNTTIKIIITATQPPATMAAINAFVPAIIAFTADTVAFAVVLTAAADAFAVARAACAAFWAVFAEAFAAACADLAVTYFQIQHHIVISGFLVLFQNGSHLILNGSQFLHTYLRIWKGDSPKRLPPDTLLLLSVTDVQPDCSAHNEHHKHNGDHRLYFHSLVLLLLLFQPCDQERTCTNEGNCRQSSPEERIEVIPCFRGVTQFIVHLNNRS